MNRKGFISVVSIALLVAACASQVQPTVNIASSAAVKAGKVIYVSITAASEIASDSDYASSLSEFQSTLSDKIHAAFPGTSVVYSQAPAGSSSGQRMEITVLDFKHVSGSGRFWGGIFAGKARLQVRVQITDLQTGKLVGDTSMGTSSSTGAGIFGATTSRQIDGISDAIVNMLGGSAATSSR